MSYRTFDRSRQREQQQERQREQFISAQFLFNRVLEAYIEIVSLPLIGAIVYDPDGPPARLLCNRSLDFRLDVEASTEKALADSPDLQKAWIDLALGKTVKPTTAHRLIRACAKSYRAIDPNRYFVRSDAR